MQVTGLDHVQLAIPAGGEDAARAFYSGLLGLAEVAKPAALTGRGGCWFRGPGLSLHLGIEQPFAAASKAHVALGVEDLDQARTALVGAGVPVVDDDVNIGLRRFYLSDPFGNRIELVERPGPRSAPGVRASRGQFEISTDRARLDQAWLVAALSERAYWSVGRSAEAIRRSVEGSICYGLYRGPQQVGIARVVTDGATFAWLCDVFIDEAWRGQGLGIWLIETIVTEPDLAGIHRFILATRDAGELYRRHGGFEALPNPERWMARISS